MSRNQYATPRDRILANTEEIAGFDYKGTPCRLWTGTLNTDGYPYMSVRQRGKPYPIKVLAHRMMCSILNGPPPTAKHQAGHLCHRPRCVIHLKWVTQSENERMKNEREPIEDWF